MLRYRHVSYAYGEVAALDDVSFDAREGEIVGLIGENGAGKSTALRLLMGFLTPDRGEVLLSGGAAFGCLTGRFCFSHPADSPHPGVFSGRTQSPRSSPGKSRQFSCIFSQNPLDFLEFIG